MSPRQREKVARLILNQMQVGQVYTSTEIRDKIGQHFSGGLYASAVANVMRQMEGEGLVRRVGDKPHSVEWELVA